MAKAKVSPEGTLCSPHPSSGHCARLSSWRTALSSVEIFPYGPRLPRATELGAGGEVGAGKNRWSRPWGITHLSVCVGQRPCPRGEVNGLRWMHGWGRADLVSLPDKVSFKKGPEREKEKPGPASREGQ